MNPRRPSPFDQYPVAQTHVFVPGIMGAGVLLSLGLVVVDAIAKLRGSASQEREVELTAAFMTEDVLRSVHHEHAVEPEMGLRPRRTYALAAIGFLGIAVYGLIGSFWNFVNPIDQGWAEDIGWIWALSNIAVLGLGCLGAVLGFIAWRHPRIPDWSRRFLARSVIGRPPTG